jgi:hypothetical protein
MSYNIKVIQKRELVTHGCDIIEKRPFVRPPGLGRNSLQYGFKT